jgi:ribosomal-protein-alanine N-acetyltransferase
VKEIHYFPKHSIPVVEPMREEHLEHIAEIDELSFNQPYSRDIFKEELSLDIAHPQILRVGDQIVGFIDYWIVRGEIHLINIAVHPAYRRRHYASFLMNHLEDVAQRNAAKKIFLDVRRGNVAGVALYEKFGFKKVGIRRRYYSDNNEDAIVMSKSYD